MRLQPTAYYHSHLATLHQQLMVHTVTQTYLSGTAIRYDGTILLPSDRFDLSFCELSTLEFAHLFSIFDGSRVHRQATRHPGADEAPPGLYFTIINNRVIQSPFKNKLGLFSQDTGTTDLFIKGLHIDHYCLDRHQIPRWLGTIAFALCAITAHLAGLGHISLIAAGGRGFSKRYIGYRVWPKLGFDARLLSLETAAVPHLHGCKTVQDVLTVDPVWWDIHGSQRLMTFELGACSASWQKLLAYIQAKVFSGGSNDQGRHPR